jgi:hypothetical protein
MVLPPCVPRSLTLAKPNLTLTLTPAWLNLAPQPHNPRHTTCSRTGGIDAASSTSKVWCHTWYCCHYYVTVRVGLSLIKASQSISMLQKMSKELLTLVVSFSWSNKCVPYDSFYTLYMGLLSSLLKQPGMYKLIKISLQSIFWTTTKILPVILLNGFGIHFVVLCMAVFSAAVLTSTATFTCRRSDGSTLNNNLYACWQLLEDMIIVHHFCYCTMSLKKTHYTELPKLILRLPNLTGWRT